MNRERIQKLLSLYQKMGNTEQEKILLNKMYTQHYDWDHLHHRLKELDASSPISKTSILCLQPQSIFEFEWVEGFGATIYTMISYMNFCLKYQYYFSLSSPLGMGLWTDFFEPFWNETEKQSIYYQIKKRTTIPALRIYKNHIEGYIHKNGKNLFLKPDYKNILDQIYHLKNEAKKQVELKIEALNLPQSYVCIHIRKGDRVNHRAHNKKYSCPCNIEIKTYLETLKKYCPHIKNIFVATDDFEVVEELTTMLSSRAESEVIQKALHLDGFATLAMTKNLYTLTQPTQHGNITAEFLKDENKYDNFIQLFTEIEIAKRSTFFIGTYCSVLSHLMQAMHGVEESVLLY